MTRSADETGWHRLVEELDRWGEAGTVATFWWRDDDAVEATPQLETLLDCAGSLPVSLAVVPRRATVGLANRLRSQASVTVLQHGWRHDSHAPDGFDEYPAGRSYAEVSAELAEGRARLDWLFGAQAIPVFVPPWHGFDDCFLSLLVGNGLSAISRKGPRPTNTAAPGVFQANAHVSPIRWTDPPSFEDDHRYLDQVVDHLRGRRLGHCDGEEATGLLTHHLVQDRRSFAFIGQFVELVSRHPSAAWLSARTVFAPALR
jgi:hypothetical protein